MVTCPHTKSRERNYEKKKKQAFWFPMLFAVSFQTAPLTGFWFQPHGPNDKVHTAGFCEY